jgi:hypothetical protein
MFYLFNKIVFKFFYLINILLNFNKEQSLLGILYNFNSFLHCILNMSYRMEYKFLKNQNIRWGKLIDKSLN